LFTLTINVHAQDVNPKDGVVEHNDSERPCIVVNLDPEPKPLKEAWKSFLKDNYDFKIKGIGFLTNKDLLYAEEVIIEDISSKRMDFYTKIVEDEVGSEMKVFGSFGYDIYIDKNETPEEYAIMNKMLTSFLESYLPKYYKSEVKATKEKVKDLSKEVNDLKKDISDNKEDIEDLNSEIEELTKEAAEKESELTIANNKLRERKAKLERIKSKYQN
jgi:gas vesicle protein